ncbi:MAG: hypothetical protein HC913_20865 [Microscillaceae bacterium]|nr:hypothetical protein [Microscillaceae bacterium]
MMKNAHFDMPAGKKKLYLHKWFWFGGFMAWLGMGFLPALAQKQKIVYVSTPGELIEQIAPDRIIRLKSSLFLLSETNLRTNNPYVNLRYDKEGLAIEIRQVDNLSLIGEKAMNVRLIHNGRNQTILSFTDCKNLSLQDLEVGFGAGPRPAEGRLLVFQNVKGLNLSNLRLWGGEPRSPAPCFGARREIQQFAYQPLYPACPHLAQLWANRPNELPFCG